jgi:hypothetical protein
MEIVRGVKVQILEAFGNCRNFFLGHIPSGFLSTRSLISSFLVTVFKGSALWFLFPETYFNPVGSTFHLPIAETPINAATPYHPKSSILGPSPLHRKEGGT